ncbi:uncharacterized protein MEPE_06622 [Melanopsichium pennsylvanicum]|uniref:UNC-45/Cro1/She4 central domain-containing protein n=2 Tax=Melanopsichium pennsylvanicum TaxID=63383 RepID=A0AAJ4XTJ2_9BASI|nr:arm repeat-containing protein [Melanopsichium pennsylvanicum 4]SNX87911.1 uncharacterized protein MEPE_06622 [Melanopsichium pennsylvanicum]
MTGFELIDSIRRSSVADEPLITDTVNKFIDAFAPLSHAHTRSNASVIASTSQVNASLLSAELKQAQSIALLSLASRSSSENAAPTLSVNAKRTDENLPQLLIPVMRSRLADTTPYSLLSALNFFSAMFSVLPTEAHDILIADGIIDLVLEAPGACNALNRSANLQSDSTSHFLSDQDLVSLAVAELFSSAANATATRKYLAGQHAILDWLDIACVSRSANSDVAGLKHKGDAIAIVAGLADIKMHFATASEAVQGLTESVTNATKPTSQQDHIRKIQKDRADRKRKDESLYRTVRNEVLAIVSRSSTQQSSSSIQQVVLAEHVRTLQLSCLEVLAYLTVQPSFKEIIAADPELLKSLCTNFDTAAVQASEDKQTVVVASQRYDGALQLSLATILSNITAYPPLLTAEEKEVKRLRNFANVQGAKQGEGQTEEEEDLETVSKVEQRCTAVLEAKGVEAISNILVSRPLPSSSATATQATSSWKVNPSKSVRRACGQALLSLVTKQDRMARGKAVQQGALKAVLAISAPILHMLLPNQSDASKSQLNGLFSRSGGGSTDGVNSEDLAPLQALAKLLISLNPSILFPSHDALLSVAPVMCSLLLCQSALRLHKFEALLALTNLASLSPEVCLRIAAFSLESTIPGKQEGTKDFSSTSVVAQACEQLLMEDHAMVRRAWIELLVNLLQIQEVLVYFTTTGSESFSKAEAAGKDQDRLTLRLRMLLGLTEVDEWAYNNLVSVDDKSSKACKADSESAANGEPSFATRMACLAILTMVTESSNVINALLTLDKLFPILMSNLILDQSEDKQRNEWERADLQSANTDPKRSNGNKEAQVQLNGINLSLRACYVLINVLHHLQGSPKITTQRNGGFDKDVVQSTLHDIITHHVVRMRNGMDPSHVEEARKGLLQLMAKCLKVVREIKIA